MIFDLGYYAEAKLEREVQEKMGLLVGNGVMNMAASENFKEYVLDQLRELESVTIKKMFGGYGIYADGLIFGLIADDILYFKVDDSNRSDYELAGTGPFKPFEDKPMLMPYYEVPVDILEDRTSLAGWSLKALRVSASAPAKKKRNKK